MTGHADLFVLGTLAEVPEQLQTKSGKLWLKLLIEIKTWKRGNNGEPGQEETTLLTINAFSKLAETARAYLQVGDPVALNCRVSGTEYKGNDGKIRRGTTITCDTLHLIPNGSRQSSDTTRQSSQGGGVLL